MSNRIRYTLDEIRRNVFYQMPKFLFEGEFKKLSNDARVLYSLLRDRHELSIKNQWLNENGEVYLIFSRESMCDMINLSEKTITKAMNELKKNNLIDEQRRGLGKPNLIYLLTVENLDFTQNRKIYGSGTVNFPPQEPENFPPNKTNMNETETNKNILSNPILSVLPETQKTEREKTDGIGWDEISTRSGEQSVRQTKKESLQDVVVTFQSTRLAEKPSIPRYDYNTVSEIIKSNIEYDYILMDKTVSEDLLDEIVHIVTSTICNDFKDGYIDMGAERVYAETVRSVFFKLDREEIENYSQNFLRQTNPIIKTAAYIRTSLYRNHRTGNHHVTNRVYVDMPYLAEPKVGSQR